MDHPDSGPRSGGFALPFAIIVLVAFSLAVGLLIDGAVASFRSADADLELVRVAASAESALSAGLDTRLDSTARASAPGTVLFALSSSAPDSVSLRVQMLASPMVRIIATVRSRSGQFRASIGRLAYAKLVRDSVSVGGLRIIPAGPAWWVPIP